MDLFSLARPFTVFGRVVTVGVYAVYTFVFRAFAHISKEVSKIVPSFTDFYTSRAVPFVIVARRVVTAGLHGLPCLVRSRVAHAVFTVTHTYEAPARAMASAFKIIVSSANSFAAITATYRDSFYARCAGRNAQYNKHSKSLIGEVSNLSSHIRIIPQVYLKGTGG